LAEGLRESFTKLDLFLVEEKLLDLLEIFLSGTMEMLTLSFLSLLGLGPGSLENSA